MKRRHLRLLLLLCVVSIGVLAIAVSRGKLTTYRLAFSGSLTENSVGWHSYWGDTVQHGRIHVVATFPGATVIDDNASILLLERHGTSVSSILMRIGPKTVEETYTFTDNLIDRLQIHSKDGVDGSHKRLDAWMKDHSDRGNWPRMIVGTSEILDGPRITVTLGYSFDDNRPWCIDIEVEDH